MFAIDKTKHIYKSAKSFIEIFSNLPSTAIVPQVPNDCMTLRELIVTLETAYPVKITAEAILTFIILPVLVPEKVLKAKHIKQIVIDMSRGMVANSVLKSSIKKGELELLFDRQFCTTYQATIIGVMLEFFMIQSEKSTKISTTMSQEIMIEHEGVEMLKIPFSHIPTVYNVLQQIQEQADYEIFTTTMKQFRKITSAQSQAENSYMTTRKVKSF